MYYMCISICDRLIACSSSAVHRSAEPAEHQNVEGRQIETIQTRHVRFIDEFALRGAWVKVNCRTNAMTNDDTHTHTHTAQADFARSRRKPTDQRSKLRRKQRGHNEDYVCVGRSGDERLLSGRVRAMPLGRCRQVEPPNINTSSSSSNSSSNSTSTEWRCGCLVHGVGRCPRQSVRQRGNGYQQEPWPQERAQHVHGAFWICFDKQGEK